MIKFEEHVGLLFRMLEEPVPLTADAELPCLIRPIQDDSPMGRYVQQCWGHDKLFMREYTICGINADMAAKVGVARDTPLSIHMFEIIGTPVAEGSAKWALYHAINGEIVTMDDCGIYKIQDGKLWECFPNDSKEWRVVADDGYGYWLEYIHDNTGWEIYKEPKPLLAEAKVGDLVKLRNGSYSQIVEVKDGSVFKYQNPEVISSVALFLCDENGDTSRWGKVKDVDIIHTEPLAPEGTAEWALQMMKLGNKVRNRDWDGGIHEKSLLYCQLIGETIKYNEGCSAFDVCLSDWEAPYIKNTGWQLYEPEQLKTMPVNEFADLLDAPIGWICKTRDGGSFPLKYIEVFPTRYAYEDKSGLTVYVMANGRYKKNGTDGRDIISCEHEQPKPEPQYKVGDFVEIINQYSGTKHLGQIDSIDHEIHIGTHRFNTNGNSAMETLPQLNIIRKLKPSEVIVEIGCLSGTVRRINDIFFCLNPSTEKGWVVPEATIPLAMLDTPTRKIVESLLKAQEEANGH